MPERFKMRCRPDDRHRCEGGCPSTKKDKPCAAPDHPRLDIKDGRVVKGVKFVDLADAGDPVELARRYENEGADELVFLDITATVEGRRATLAVVRAVAAELTIPFAVGGGVQSVEDINDLLRAGCDKASVNSAALRTPELIDAASRRFGAQCIVVAIDARTSPGTPSG